MNFKKCVRNALRDGRISNEEAKSLEKKYNEIASQLSSDSKAKEQLISELDAELIDRQRRSFLSAEATKRLVNQLTDENGQIDPNRFLYMHEHVGEVPDIQDAATKHLAIIGVQAHARLDELLHEFRKGAIRGDARRSERWWGSRKTQVRMDNVVSELFGQSTKDAKAKAMAEAFTEVAEDLRVRFNEAGGSIGKLEKWGLPQWHDPLALMNVGREAWVTRMMQPDVLNRDRMVNQVTKRKLTDAELREALETSYERIVSEGWFDREPSGVPVGRGALWSQHADHRFIHFKDGKAWRQYAKDFGNPDPYAAMMGHISTMARDIAHMETFGPNPNVTREYLKQVIQQAVMTGKVDRDRAVGAVHRADAMWDVMRGSANAPVNSRVANVLQNARNVITSAVLGAAVLSAVSDVAFGSARRGFVGMARDKAMPYRVLYETVRQMVQRDNVREAVRSGLILDSAMHVMHAQARYVASIDTTTITGFLADRTISLQGLAAWTQAAKHAFAMDMQGMFADHVGTSWYDLPDYVRDTLDRGGFNGQFWDAIRRTKLHEPQPGAVFLRPVEIAAQAGRDLAERYAAMLMRETRYAVPEATIRSSSILRGGSKPGTLIGELARNFAQFKGFAVSVVMLPMAQIARDIGAGRGARAAQYAGALFITGAIMGVLAMAMKDIVAGRDPRRWTDEETYLDPAVWGAAILQAGGLGIFGDFLFSSVNRFGGGLETTIAGPLVGRASDLNDLTTGNILEMMQGKKTNAGREAVRFLRQNTPIATSLWYTSLVYQRVLMDQLQRLADPDAQASFSRQISKRKSEYGQEFWWAPGETSPRRPPNLAPLVGME